MGVLTDFFRATEVELRAHYPGWKVPLAQPLRKPGINPFSKKPIEVLSWDPSPDKPVTASGPSRPPSPSIDLKGLGHTSVASLIAIVHDPSKDIADRFYGGALLGPDDGPWVHELPAAFVAKLAALDAAALDTAAKRWTDVEAEDGSGTTYRQWRRVLDELARFARATVAERKNMYMWVSL
jgi:hypothetical protein